MPTLKLFFFLSSIWINHSSTSSFELPVLLYEIRYHVNYFWNKVSWVEAPQGNLKWASCRAKNFRRCITVQTVYVRMRLYNVISQSGCGHSHRWIAAHTRSSRGGEMFTNSVSPYRGYVLVAFGTNSTRGTRFFLVTYVVICSSRPKPGVTNFRKIDNRVGTSTVWRLQFKKKIPMYSVQRSSCVRTR